MHHPDVNHASRTSRSRGEGTGLLVSMIQKSECYYSRATQLNSFKVTSCKWQPAGSGFEVPGRTGSVPTIDLYGRDGVLASAIPMY